MDILKSFANMPLRRRLLILVSCGVVLLGVNFYPSNSSKNEVAAVAPVLQTNAVSARPNIKPAMPTGYQITPLTRDPFSLPPELTQTSGTNAIHPNERGYSAAQAYSQSKTNVSDNYRLTGVATAGGTRVAVIASDGKSKPFRVNESIGSYKISCIDSTSVTLTGPSGKRILRLDSVKEGGKHK
ncbi:hypothetical protein SDC9_86705 [bioreactor metagenome]|uniref:Type II secretion system protein GspC N-terminal domain-containing protein n=1 Tax=bioreactor metagenome TaxID=1076179 RepID=A0A644ZH73_9ZZZZ